VFWMESGRYRAYPKGMVIERLGKPFYRGMHEMQLCSRRQEEGRSRAYACRSVQLLVENGDVRVKLVEEDVEQLIDLCGRGKGKDFRFELRQTASLVPGKNKLLNSLVLTSRSMMTLRSQAGLVISRTASRRVCPARLLTSEALASSSARA